MKSVWKIVKEGYNRNLALGAWHPFSLFLVEQPPNIWGTTSPHSPLSFFSGFDLTLSSKGGSAPLFPVRVVRSEREK